MPHTLAAMLDSVELPQLILVQRHFAADSIADLPLAIHATLEASQLSSRLVSGGSVALGVGSRGISRLPETVRTVAAWFKAQGVHPFIVPSMGSHGGATAEGQRRILEQLGITEDSVGCPIQSCMDVVRVGTVGNGLPVYLDAAAHQADGIFVINRVKAHTAFTGTYESGLLKMLTIGLGKQRGADACHELGFGHFAEIMPEMGRSLLHCHPSILGGLALLENESDAIFHVESVPMAQLLEREVQLLALAKQRMPNLPMRSVDALLVQQMGKDISGAGMDPNVTGRSPSPYKEGGISATKLGVLRLTAASKGNATGMGTADVATQMLYEAIDFPVTYMNVMTSTVLRSGTMPVIMPHDKAAVQCLIKTCNAPRQSVRLAYIKDTLNLSHFWVSPALAEELRQRDDCSVGATSCSFSFDSHGTLQGPEFV